MLKPPTIPILAPGDLLDAMPRAVPRHDLHLHTDFTDGKATIGAYLDRAIELGLERRDPAREPRRLQVAVLREADVLEAERARVRGRLRVHWGIEAKGMDKRGTLAATPEMIDAAEYVFGAFHSSQTKTPFPELEQREAIEMEYEVILGMIEARSCHAVAHPGGL